MVTSYGYVPTSDPTYWHSTHKKHRMFTYI